MSMDLEPIWSKIYDEYLYYYPNGRETKIFDRTDINIYTYSQKDERKLRDIENKNAPNKFFLATSTTWNFEKTRPAFDFLTTGINICFNIEELKRIAFDMYEKEDEKRRNFYLEESLSQIVSNLLILF